MLTMLKHTNESPKATMAHHYHQTSSANVGSTLAALRWSDPFEGEGIRVSPLARHGFTSGSY